MKYKSKPKVIEAIQYNGNNATEIMAKFGMDQICEDILGDFLEIETLEGTMKANKGDYIIKGIQGEFYPCKPDVFTASYEAIDE